ncbi:hypothetical protein V5N11_034160 [Cardamine amara subsp. amara]|uniref:Reverse transcriptase domain-containing protein n=1 Tax=Cardamine amara subsp. amara TaxID=228776 RepID=A0ABD1B4W8_CARAN
MLKDLTVKLPLVDAVQMVPALKRYMKELVAGKVVEEENVMMVTKECSAILQNKVLTKKGDPGKIGPMTFACSLCDLGSSVNLMPYSVVKRLGFIKFKPTKISLVFADRSTKLPIGIIEDVHVRIGAPAPTTGAPASDDSISGSWSELKAPKLRVESPASWAQVRIPWS